ncbi:MAG: DegT/DnrJ/EryC1/StrS family aminotransferase [Flavobacteriales bacterium]|nr:DegT/DnrJ/EryC1/StrS family aminotransferase [Flavobacteriales bacterium]MDG1767157.1 DegT/DnrJ/EryC1/StrS family aminotransferase [Flavobacteriales bacterium]
MANIQMVDLKGQYEKIRTEVDQAINEVVRSSAFINGPEVKDFQTELEEYLGVKHVIPCANGTDALQIAMMALDLKEGDEVITTNFTFIATVEVIALLKLKPVLVDVDPDTYNIDPEKLREAISPNTKAIVPVHLFGQCANMNEIMAIAEEKDIYVVEDTAQAISARYTLKDGSVKTAGTMGHIGATSFFPSKNLGCYGDGGALYTNDDALADRARQICNHGMRVRYYHELIGVNSRLDSIQAAVLRIKLRKLDEYCDARIAAADYYDAAFASIPEIKTPKRAEDSTHTFHQYTLRVPAEDRNHLQKHLMDQDIPAMIYYPVPLHEQEAFEAYKTGETEYPVTVQLSKEVISLPMHTELTEDQLKTITQEVISYFKNK